MNGIIVVNKEIGMSSHDVVNKIRKIFNTKRVGHLGTLDPLASGVLVVCLNDATKLVQFLQDHDKTYIARVCFGMSTDTYDLEGKITNKLPIREFDEKMLDDAILSFKGESMQLPPLYSSIKVDGKKLYEYAREGKNVEIAKRPINIHDIKRISNIELNNDCCYFNLLAKVSKGTYIRSLCYDLGMKLNVPSLMAGLIRVSSDKFTLDNANTLAEIESGKYHVFSMLDALWAYQKIDNDYFSKKAMSGMKISLNDVNNELNSLPDRFVIKNADILIAIYELSSDKKYYKAARVWN